MEIRNVEDCFRFRLLRKIKPDEEKTKKSFEISKKKLIEAERAIQLEPNFNRSFILRIF